MYFYNFFKLYKNPIYKILKQVYVSVAVWTQATEDIKISLAASR